MAMWKWWALVRFGKIRRIHERGGSYAMDQAPSVETVRSELKSLIDQYAPTCSGIALTRQADFDEQIYWFRSYLEPCGRYVLLATLRWSLDHHEVNGWYTPALGAAMFFLNALQRVSADDIDLWTREEGQEGARRRCDEMQEFSRGLKQEFEAWPSRDQKAVWAWLRVAAEWDVVKPCLAEELEGALEYWGRLVRGAPGTRTSQQA
jgi:hypothetical protein